MSPWRKLVFGYAIERYVHPTIGVMVWGFITMVADRVFSLLEATHYV